MPLRQDGNPGRSHVAAPAPLLLCLRRAAGGFPGGPVCETWPSVVGGAGLIPGRRAKIPHAQRPENQNMKQKRYCKNSIKTLKIAHIKKIKKKKEGQEDQRGRAKQELDGRQPPRQPPGIPPPGIHTLGLG